MTATLDPTEPIDVRSTERSPGATRRFDLRRWPPWAPLVAVTALALVLNCWNLSGNGLGNTYYAAAARSMSESWQNFFFASFDPGGFISVDKPPVALWCGALSVRIFGFSSWSLLLPSALAGTGAVALLGVTVRRHFGIAAATVAAALLALSPVNVAVNRLNLPEPFMILFLVAAAWAVSRSFDSARSLRWLLLAGAFVGLAFNTKMLAAYIPVVGIGLAVIVGTRGDWWRRVRHGAVFGGASILCSLPWIVVVDLWPTASRPYVGGSTDNTVWDLVFGYNGLGRVDGGQAQVGGGGPGGGGNLAGPGGVFGGEAGLLRLLNDAVGGQIAWLLPVGILGAIAALYLYRRDRTRAAGIVMWAGWALTCGVVFSYAQGTFHSYYTSLLAPGLAAAIGIGSIALVKLVREHGAWLAAIAGTLLATVMLQLDLDDRTPTFFDWTKVVLVGAAVAAVIGVAAALLLRRPKALLSASLAVALLAVAFTPAAWAVSEAMNPTLNSTLPQAGPRGGSAGGTFGSASFAGETRDTALADFLRAQQDGETWNLVVSSAMQASELIAQDDLSVMALGGFLGSDPAATVESIADDVADGDVRYFLTGGAGPGGAGRGAFPGGGSLPGSGGASGPPQQFPPVNGGGGVQPPTGGRPAGGGFGGGPGGTGAGATENSAIMSAVQDACTPVTADVTTSVGGAHYDCRGRADAIREAGTT